MKQVCKRVTSYFLTFAMVCSMLLGAVPNLVYAASSTVKDLHMQDGWTVKKGDTASTGENQGSTKLATTGEMTMNHLVSDPAKNGNGHLGGSLPEAFVLTDNTYTDEAFSFTIRLGSASAETRFRFVTKYVDDTHWGHIAYDTGNWLYEYKDGSSGNWPSLPGLPSMDQNDVVKINGAYTSAGLEVTVENVTSGEKGTAVTNAANYKETEGKVGLGAGTYSSVCTDIYFSDVKLGGTAYTGTWAPYKEVGTWKENVAVGGTTVRNMAAGSDNTNTKDGKAYISKASYTGVDSTKGGALETTFVNNTPAGTTADFGVLVRYTDKDHWSSVGHDGSKWYYRVVNGAKDETVPLSGYTTAPAVGASVSLSITYTGDSVTSIKINGTDTTFTAITDFASLAEGTIGYQLGKNTVLAISALSFTPVKEEETPAEGGKKWYYLEGGSNNGGGHAYGNANAKAPVLALDQDRTMSVDGGLSLTFKPVTSTNFGIFYTYKDDSQWLYIGYDTTSKWYYQYQNGNKGSYPGIAGLPAPVPGESMNISISLSHETLTVEVDGVRVGIPNKDLMELAESVNGTGKFGVKTNGAASVQFADFKLGNQDCMNDNWDFCAKRDGQILKTVYTDVVDIVGMVGGENDVPLSGATVRIGKSSTKTDAQGFYKLEKVEVGTHQLAVTCPGYIAYSREKEITKNTHDMSFFLQKKPPLNLEDYDYIASDSMKVYVGKDFPLAAQYQVQNKAATDIFRGQETVIDKVAINGVEIKPEVQVEAGFQNGSASKTYSMNVKDAENSIDLTMDVKLSVEGNDLTWEVTKLQKNEGCAKIQTIDVPQLNLVSLDAVEKGAQFDGAQASNDTTVIGDSSITFEDGFVPSESEGYMYGFITNEKLSAGLWSNSEAEGDKRVVRNNGADTLSLTSAPWYYEAGDKNGQKTDYEFQVSELPCAKVAIAGDLNEDGAIDWNDGALGFRKIMNYAYGSEDIKDMVNYRIVMNFASAAPNPYLETADNIKKVYLATDGLPQAVMLKGYGNEGHDSANSEYADISEREGGVDEFQKLIQIAHGYDTEVGIHVNAQESYPESKSFCEEMLSKPFGNGWGWLDQSNVINKLWDLSSDARWKRFVQLYDRINGTSFYSNAWPEAVGASTGTVASREELAVDSAPRKDNMDFIYLDVWYQDAWETRQIADQINSLGWRFSTEFSYEGEYDSTWQHWSTDASYGGKGAKGYNSEIIRFLRNDQRDSQVLNYPQYGGTADNPLLGGYRLYGFEGWGGDQSFDNYILQTFNQNLPTRFLQHYYVTKWVNYDEENGETSPTGNREKEITLKNDAGDTVVVTRNEAQRSDENIERTITLNGRKVLDDVTYLLPWEDEETGEQKLYHWNLDGGATTWTLPNGWENLGNVVMYELSDQGRINEVSIPVSNNSVTLEAKAATAYVVAKGAAVKTLKEDFGEFNYVADPDFNGYVEGEKLSADTWSGDITNAAVGIEVVPAGSQNLVIDSPNKDIAVATEISGLKKGTDYVAEIYINNESDEKASITVNTGNKQVSNYTMRSIAGNYYRCDEYHGTNMQQILVSFTAESETAELTLSREAGAGKTYFDDIRVVEISLANIQEDGSFVQDYETVVQGLYPFVLGPAQGIDDPVSHLSQLHAPFTQAGWNGKYLDDVLGGEWSVKYHDSTNGGVTGLIYRTIPQHFRFEAGKVYNVEFDYQAGSDQAFVFVTGDGENYELPDESEFFNKTWDENGAQTKRHTMKITGSGSGQTWIGLYADKNKIINKDSKGKEDFILDNLKITEDKEAVSFAVGGTELYLGETAQISGSNLDKITFSSSDENVAALDKDNRTVKAVGNGTATITGKQGDKLIGTVDITVKDKVLIELPREEGMTAWANTEESDGKAELAADGNSSTIWHSHYSTGQFVVSEENPAILTVDLGAEMDLAGFKFQQRSGYNGIVHQYSYKAFSNVDEAENTAAGFSESIVTTTAERTSSAWVTAEFKESVKARYIQIKVEKGFGDFASIAEVAALNAEYVAKEVTLKDAAVEVGGVVTLEPVHAEGTLVKGLVWSSDKPEIASVDKYGNVTGMAEGTAVIRVSNAAGLEASCTVTVETKKTVDKTALENLVAEYAGLNKDDYTEAAWNTFEAVLNHAKAALEKADITQEEVNQWVSDLKTAKDVLEQNKKPADNPGGDPDDNPGGDPDDNPGGDPDDNPGGNPDNNPGGNTPDSDDKPGAEGNTATGWDAVKETIANSAAGSATVINMGGETKLPADVLRTIQGQNKKLVLKLKNGVKWTIDGKTIQKEGVKDIDLNVILNSNAISEKLVKSVADGKKSIQISLAHEGDFGFTAELTIPLGAENSGLVANLYYYNKTSGKLELMTNGKVDKDGNVVLTFTHASDYVIVLDSKAHTAPKTGDTSPVAGMVLLLFAAAVLGAAAVRRRKVIK